MGYPQSMHRFNVNVNVAAQCGSGSCSEQISRHFRELASGIPGVLESSQRAALVGDTLIRTAGIVE